jgi:hypothetical protein
MPLLSCARELRCLCLLSTLLVFSLLLKQAAVVIYKDVEVVACNSHCHKMSHYSFAICMWQLIAVDHF